MHSASLGFNHIYGVIASEQQIKSDKSGSKLTGNFHITNPEIELKKTGLFYSVHFPLHVSISFHERLEYTPSQVTLAGSTSA